MSDSFWKLPRDERWLGDRDDPYSIGGRDTDLSQLGHSITYRVRESYQVNEVPGHIVLALSALQATLTTAEDEVAAFIELVSADQLRLLRMRLHRAKYASLSDGQYLEMLEGEDPDDRAIREAHGIGYPGTDDDETCPQGCGYSYQEIMAGKMHGCVFGQLERLRPPPASPAP